MASRDKKSVFVKSVLGALDAVRGKPSPGKERSPQDCGDIGLKIARDGTWYYQNSAIERKPLVKLFASVLRRDDDGRYCLVTPVEKVLVDVEDAPFLAVALDVEGSGKHQRLTFRTNIGDLVEAGAAHPFSFRAEKDGSFTPFILVRDRLQARIARPVYYELVAVVSQVQGGAPELGVWSGGIFFPFPAPRGSGAD